MSEFIKISYGATIIKTNDEDVMNDFIQRIYKQHPTVEVTIVTCIHCDWKPSRITIENYKYPERLLKFLNRISGDKAYENFNID